VSVAPVIAARATIPRPRYGLALPRQEANEVKKAFGNIEKGSLGLLVSQGQGHVSFFHRSVQQYLAAVHVSRMPLATEVKLVQEHLADSRWRDVIAGVIHLCQRGDDASALVDGIERHETDLIGSLSKDDILAEMAFRSTKLRRRWCRSSGEYDYATVEAQIRICALPGNG
jgi:hypothetical protein